jgi:hypothetical protein
VVPVGAASSLSQSSRQQSQQGQNENEYPEGDQPHASDMTQASRVSRSPLRNVNKRNRYSWTAVVLIPAWTSGIAYWLFVGMYVDAATARMPGGLGLMVRLHQYWLLSLLLASVLFLVSMIFLEEARSFKKRAEAAPYGYHALIVAAVLGAIFIGLLLSLRVWAL